MSQLIGTASNQVPTNGDLGSAAFMDSSAFYGTGQSASFRNRIINGDMRIDQRNAGGVVTINTNLFTVDRWQADEGGMNSYTAQQSTTAPAGFKNSLKFTMGTAVTIDPTDYAFFRQAIEGYNVADFGLGTTSASPFTLSFWVQSSVTGTFGVTFRNTAANTSYCSTYTINTANTWEYKTVTVPAITTGTWVTDNGAGMYVLWDLGVGSTYTGIANQVNTGGNYFGVANTTKLASTTGATFYITGVQLEKGTQATPFEYRPYGMELALCQRYYWQSFEGATPSGWPSNGFISTAGVGGSSGGNTTGMINGMFLHPVKMRAAPTGSVWDHLNAAGKVSVFNPNVGNYGGETGSIVNTSQTTFMINRNSGNSATQIGAHVALNADL